MLPVRWNKELDRVVVIFPNCSLTNSIIFFQLVVLEEVVAVEEQVYLLFVVQMNEWLSKIKSE